MREWTERNGDAVSDAERRGDAVSDEERRRQLIFLGDQLDQRLVTEMFLERNHRHQEGNNPVMPRRNRIHRRYSFEAIFSGIHARRNEVEQFFQISDFPMIDFSEPIGGSVWRGHVNARSIEARIFHEAQNRLLMIRRGIINPQDHPPFFQHMNENADRDDDDDDDSSFASMPDLDPPEHEEGEEEEHSDTQAGNGNPQSY